MPATMLYTGAQHLNVMAGVNLLRETFGKDRIDIKILSAGYGLIDERHEVVPHEVTFNDLRLAELEQWSKKLNIREDFENSIAGYDLVFILLGEHLPPRSPFITSIPFKKDPSHPPLNKGTACERRRTGCLSLRRRWGKNTHLGRTQIAR